MRKLASIQTVQDITTIEGYDRVELATILGWECIIKKGDFKIGDKCVYFEPDSLLYPHPIWNTFLEKRKFKIKTIKMCGVYSQGLVLPVSVIEELKPGLKWKKEDGYDLTEDLDVKHFEKGGVSKSTDTVKKSKNPIVRFFMQYRWFRFIYAKLYGGKSKGSFPSEYISKSDETNIQGMPSVLEKNRGVRFYITEKLEGQSATYLIKPLKGVINNYFNKTEFMVCSRNLKKGRPDGSSWWTVAEQFGIKKIIEKYYKETGIMVAIQGEIIGEGVQDNIYKIKGYDFYVFTIKDIMNDRLFTMIEKEEFCERTGLKMVPLIDRKFIIDDNVTVKSLLEKSNGTSVLYNTKREGIVLRKYIDDRISFKVRSPEYLSGEK